MSEKLVPALLKIGNINLELPRISGNSGPDVIDIRKLYSEANVFTFDPGFTSTASCESSITFIDGDKGKLLYRGFDAYSSQCCWLAISRSSFERRVGIIPLPFLRLLNAVGLLLEL